MLIYKQNGNMLIAIKERKFEVEKSMQTLVEANLQEIYGLTFVCSEYQLNNLRVDTLAFDEEAKAFVVIEYKRDRSNSVIDQGYAYLALLLNNKADFVLKYNEECRRNLRKDDIDWSQARVLFLASSFTTHQKEAMGFQHLPMELWEVKQYENDLVVFHELRPSGKEESIRTVVKSKPFDTVVKELRPYDVSDHFKPSWKEGKALFDLFSKRVLELDPAFVIRPVKHFIGFHLGKKVVFELNARKKRLRLGLYRVQPKDLNDPEQRTWYSNKSVGFYNKHVTHVNMESKDDIEYTMMLIRQVYQRFVD